MNFDSALNKYPKVNDKEVKAKLDLMLKKQERVIVVLDDDPTGIQTVHGVSVYTNWSAESIEDGFQKGGMFFILTNSRAMDNEVAKQVNKDIALRINNASIKYSKEYIIISRGDSTLRGHYPLETDTLKETLESVSNYRFDGEILCPFFQEGGRYTFDDIHYVLMSDTLVPVGETEFAKDKTFGFKESNLAMWINEKTLGRYSKEKVVSIGLDILTNVDGEEIVCELLTKQSEYTRFIVNALDYSHIKVFALGFLKAIDKGEHYLIRSGAAIPKVLGGVADKPLIDKSELVENNDNGGLIIIGSHVEKTTKQLEELKKLNDIEFIEFNQHLVLDEEAFKTEIKRVQLLCNNLIKAGKDTVIYTRRDRLDVNSNNIADELDLAIKISKAITSFAKNLDVQPSYIVAKGGITSSDIGTVGLGAVCSKVLGQILPGIPVWKLGKESKFPGMSYIIFPGNVGENDSLKILAEKLR